MSKMNNLILGGGLAGLSAAYHLDSDYVIYEKESRPGGILRAAQENGFIFDRGPHILYPATEYARDLILKLMTDNLRIEKREAWIHHEEYGLQTKFPFQAHLYGLPVDIVHKCLVDLYQAIQKQHESKPTNYKEWMYWRFGAGITEHLMIPYAGRIWTIDSERMNYEWIDRRVPEPDFNTILLGALTSEAELFGANKDFWYPIKGGIEALPKSFLPHVNNVNCDMKAVRIVPDERAVEFENGTDASYERLISTLPLQEVVKLIGDVPGEVQQASDSLEHNSILCVNIGIDRADITKNHWMYFYEEGFVFHRISFPMNLSCKTVPPGKSSISCEVAYSKYRSVDKENIIERTFDDLVKAELFRKSDTIAASNVVDLFYAYVIYDINHRRNVKVIHDYLRSKNILPCGRFGEWEYFNMDQTILSGKNIADEVNAETADKGKHKVA